MPMGKKRKFIPPKDNSVTKEVLSPSMLEHKAHALSLPFIYVKRSTLLPRNGNDSLKYSAEDDKNGAFCAAARSTLSTMAEEVQNIKYTKYKI